MLSHKKFPKGEAFNIGGGKNNSISLLELVRNLEVKFNKNGSESVFYKGLEKEI